MLRHRSVSGSLRQRMGGRRGIVAKQGQRDPPPRPRIPQAWLLPQPTGQGTPRGAEAREEGRPRGRTAGPPGPRSMGAVHTVASVAPPSLPGLVRSLSHTPAPAPGDLGHPGFCRAAYANPRPAGCPPVPSTVSCASAHLAAHTTDVPTEAGTGQMPGLRSAGQEMTEPAPAPVWLGLKATLSRAPGCLLQRVAGSCIRGVGSRGPEGWSQGRA